MTSCRALERTRELVDGLLVESAFASTTKRLAKSCTFASPFVSLESSADLLKLARLVRLVGLLQPAALEGVAKPNLLSLKYSIELDQRALKEDKR